MLTRLSVKKPYSVVVAVAIIMLLGIAALVGIRTDLLPDVDYPYAVVTTEYTDASPEEVEATVTKPLEKAIASLGKTKEIHSISTSGKSIVTVEFNSSVDMDFIVAEMREAFEPLKSEWGSSISSPVIRKVNPDTMPVIVASVDVEGEDAAGISKFVNDTLMSYFDGIDGVADLSVQGLVSEQVQITIDPDKLAEINEKIYNAIDGDYAKARAALEATDADLSSASTQLSSDLLNQVASIDSQLRTLNSQLAKAQAAESTSNDQIKKLKDEISELEAQKKALTEKETPTEEDLAELEKVNSDLTQAQMELAAAQSGGNSSSDSISSLRRQISQLESQRNALTAQMSTRESELAKSRSEITSQLSALATDEETAKAEADLKTLITTEMVSSMLAAQNFSSKAGSLAMGNREYDVKVGDKISSVEELENLILFHFDLDGVEDVLLSQVANISLVNDSDKVYSKIDGHDGVLISFMKQSDYSTAEAAKNIWKVFDKVQETYPSVTITPLSDQSVYIDRVSGAVTENLVIGAVLAILVLLLFLRDLRPTLVVGVSIPVSLLFAIALMYFTGVTLNIFSLCGLALGVGMLVDNSIVVMENIYRCRKCGLSRFDAALEGVKQVSSAIVASTLTTICVFLPVVFTNGLSRQLFSDIGLTIAYSLLASLFIAFTLVPAMSAGVLRKMEKRRKDTVSPLKARYTSIMRWVLCHRVFVLVFALMLLVFSGIFAISRGTSFLPQSDSTEMTISLTMKEETTDAALWQTTDNVMSLLRDMDDVKSVGAVSDEGGNVSLSGVSEGGGTILYVVLKDDKDHTCQEIAESIQAQTENLGCDLDISIGSYDLSSLYQEGIRITVSGEDLTTLASVTEDMGDLLLSVEGIENVKSSMDTATPTLKVSVNKAEAMKYGLTVSEVYEFISRSISNSANATTLSQSGTDVIVIDGSAGDLSLADIQNLKMTVTDDNDVTSEVVIGSIATITEEEGAPVIYRNAQARYMTATAEVADGYNVGLVSDEVKELVQGYTPPEGYRVTISGENVAIDDSFHDLYLMLGLSLVLMYLIMVAQFQSLLSPLIIMLIVPLSFTGGFTALLLGGKDISVIALVGFLLLSGIVVNNGIVLVDYIDRLRRSGKPMREAIIEGGCTRARPILMTASTTILAVLTMAFGLGTGAEVIQPMAIVVFGGMLYATVMTLFVVPAIYDLFLRRKTDTVMELAQGSPLDQEDEMKGYHIDKPSEEDTEEEEEDDSKPSAKKSPGFLGSLSAILHREEEEDDDDEEEDDEDDENEESAEDKPRHRFHLPFLNRDDEEEEDEDDEDDEEEDEDESRLRRFFRRLTEDDEDEFEDDDDEDDDDEDDEEDDYALPRFGLFRRLRARKTEDDDDEEYDDDDEEDEDEEEDDASPHFRLFRRLRSLREEDEDDDEEDDEDYYGLKERRRRNHETLIDEETRRRVLQIPTEDNTEISDKADRNNEK